jgi:hypothetical protein
MPSQKEKYVGAELTKEWTLPPAATLGSSVRAKGILLEIRARLPFVTRKSLDIMAGALILRLPEDSDEDFQAALAIVCRTLQGIESLPVLPRELEDILTISTTERHRWLKDGRLKSAGTRTVRLRGRAKKITFHVFDPATVEDLLDRDLVAAWREDDAATAAENRRRAAFKAKLTRSQTNGRNGASAVGGNDEECSRPKLRGWAEFERDGPLR